MHIHVYITNIYMHVHSHRHTCTHIPECVPSHMHACTMHAHTHIFMGTQHTCATMCMHTHTHTHTHTNLAVQENVFWFQVPADIERKGHYDVEATPALLLRQRTKFTGISSGSRDPHTPWLLGRKGQAWLCATGRPHL